jgi:hypothetical protein
MFHVLGRKEEARLHTIRIPGIVFVFVFGVV